jgi:hypothetical protein
MKQRQRGNGKPVQVLGLRDAMSERLAFNENLQMLRKKYGPHSIAASLGLTPVTIWRYFHGKTVPNAVILLSVNTWAEREKQLSAESAS